ncbi:unnamed protein product [Prorocentrum cordatum]|uniref:AAA+ ATPase domain-containing protein n=1 Tax=Prorocentrum cordatum TaxID=2364126 RepID=A0ABN9TAC9_9DINO|nr:unnamed protein product [Polarella glacialis]
MQGKDLSLVSPLMLGIFISRGVSKAINKLSYDEALMLKKGVPFLEADLPHEMDRHEVVAGDICDSLPSVALLPPEAPVRKVQLALQRWEVANFPVVSSGVCIGLVSRARLEAAMRARGALLTKESAPDRVLEPDDIAVALGDRCETEEEDDLDTLIEGIGGSRSLHGPSAGKDKGLQGLTEAAEAGACAVHGDAGDPSDKVVPMTPDGPVAFGGHFYDEFADLRLQGAVSSLSSARASAEHGAASGANGSARGDCSYCRTVTDCYRYPSTCRGCQICSQVGGDVRLACPSYCSTPRDCVTLRSTCTPERCSHCGGSGGSGGGGGGGTRPGGDAEAVDRLMAELDELVGLDKVKDQMKELVAQVKFNMERERLGLPDIGGQSLHMSFLGNPGTGKTVVARIVGELMVAMGAIKPAGGRKEKDDIVVEVSRADLVAEYTGQTAPKVKQAVQKALGGVLFIDEAYALVQGDRDSFGNEAVDTLIKEMEDNRDKLIVILAGYQTEMATFLAANPGFKSRVAFHFAFPDYTCDELVQIGELLLSKKNVGIVPEPPTDGQASACYPPAGVPVPASCGWLRSGVRLRTGCCETKEPRWGLADHHCLEHLRA